METATVLSIGLGALVIAITVFTIYTAFGPPAKELADPFDDHDD
ncbi:photosystem II reaction center protein PsbN [[Phormidium] sp. ETS-05]|nr:photosystem II reaction center protein PsbN [[Phormidium] sp. ETS-05]